MMTKTLLYVTFFLVIVSACKQSKEKLILNIPDPKTLNETYISNPDNLLSSETVYSLNEKLSKLDQSGKAHIDVVFVKSIEDNIPKEIAHTLFNTWKIGSKETNNGLLIFIVEDQHRIEFETGYGLEGILPDVTCYKIQQDYMIPYAKQNDFDKAVIEGVDATIRQILKEDTETHASADTISISPSDSSPIQIDSRQPIEAPIQGLAETPQQKASREVGDFFSLIILAVYMVFAYLIGQRLTAYRNIPTLSNPAIYFLWIFPTATIILLNLYLPFEWYNLRMIFLLYLFSMIYVNFHFFILKKKLNKTLKDKSDHEQFVAWQSAHLPAENIRKAFPNPFLKTYWNEYIERLQTLRSAPKLCEKCGKKMILLSELKEDGFLSKGNTAEERIDSVDYDVWSCQSCQQQLILDYKNPKSKAKECPKCHFRTFAYKRQAIHKASTREYEGYGYIYYLCSNCNYEEKSKFTIAKISPPSSSSSSSSDSWSSSSSSSSGSSTSSGGSSGGGGAGSSW